MGRPTEVTRSGDDVERTVPPDAGDSTTRSAGTAAQTAPASRSSSASTTRSDPVAACPPGSTTPSPPCASRCRCSCSTRCSRRCGRAGSTTSSSSSRPSSPWSSSATARPAAASARTAQADGSQGDDNPGVLDWALAALALLVCLYPVLPVTIGDGGGGFNAFLDRQGSLGAVDVAMGTLLMLLILEACRRTTGLVLPIVCAVFFAFAYYGGFLPVSWSISHAGMNFGDIINGFYNDASGFFGIPLDVAATYIVLFTIYGAVLEATGASRFFIDISFAGVPQELVGARPHRRPERLPPRHRERLRHGDGREPRVGLVADPQEGRLPPRGRRRHARRGGHRRDPLAADPGRGGVHHRRVPRGQLPRGPALGHDPDGPLLPRHHPRRRDGRPEVRRPRGPHRARAARWQLLRRFGYHFLSLFVIVAFLALGIPPFRRSSTRPSSPPSSVSSRGLSRAATRSTRTPSASRSGQALPPYAVRALSRSGRRCAFGPARRLRVRRGGHHHLGHRQDRHRPVAGLDARLRGAGASRATRPECSSSPPSSRPSPSPCSGSPCLSRRRSSSRGSSSARRCRPSASAPPRRRCSSSTTPSSPRSRRRPRSPPSPRPPSPAATPSRRCGTPGSTPCRPSSLRWRSSSPRTARTCSCRATPLSILWTTVVSMLAVAALAVVTGGWLFGPAKPRRARALRPRRRPAALPAAVLDRRRPGLPRRRRGPRVGHEGERTAYAHLLTARTTTLEENA